MTQGLFYFITDDFFTVHDTEHKLMLNKEAVAGVMGNRPCFYAFPDSRQPDIFWCVPVSSKTEKFTAIYNKILKRQQTKWYHRQR